MFDPKILTETLGFMGCYLSAANLLGFLLNIINVLLSRHSDHGRLDIAVSVMAFLGGSIGILLSILIFDRKSKKENMMLRVFIVCILIMQVIIYLMMKGHRAEKLSFNLFVFFESHIYLIWYIGIINVITFIVFAIDKIAAIKHKSRIRIVTLLLFAFAGGSVGALLGMYLLRHKIRKDYFTLGIPLILIMQVVVIFYVMNAAW